MGSSTVPATTGGAINNGFQPATSGNLDEFTLYTDADGVVTRTVTIPVGDIAVYSTLAGTLTFGGNSYAISSSSVRRIPNQTSASSYTFSCSAITSGFQWRDGPTTQIATNAAFVSDFNYRIHFSCIAFGGTSNLFVLIPGYAQPGGATAFSSPDGITWTSRTLPSANFQFVTFTGSLFYATSNSQGGQLATSTDGITWTARAYSVGGIFTFPVKGSGTNYVAIRTPYATAETGTFNNTQVSTDGLTWAAGGLMPSSASWVASASDGTNARIVVIAGADDSASNNTVTAKAAYSINNGTSWTASTLPSAQRWTTLRWVPSASLYMAVNSNTPLSYATSPDGVTWTGRTFPNNTIAQAYDTNNQSAIWVGNNGVSSALYGATASNTQFVYYTTDCINFVTSSAVKNTAFTVSSATYNAAFGNNVHVGGRFYDSSSSACIPIISVKTPTSFGIYAPPTTTI